MPANEVYIGHVKAVAKLVDALPDPGEDIDGCYIDGDISVINGDGFKVATIKLVDDFYAIDFTVYGDPL